MAYCEIYKVYCDGFDADYLTCMVDTCPFEEDVKPNEEWEETFDYDEEV